MNKFLPLMGLALLLTPNAVHAATLDIILGGPTIAYDYNATQTLRPSNVTLNNHTPGLNLINNDRIIPAGDSLTSFWKAPSGITGANYLAVLGLTHNLRHEDVGAAVFTLSPGNDMLGFTWGTIDKYNDLVIVAKNGIYKITGADILSQLTGAIAGTTQVNVNISDPGSSIRKAIFASTGNSFELGNLSQFDTPVSATPIPASLLLFASGLAGLFLIAYRRRFGRV